ncbi:MAG: hypothetical protein MUF87_11675 [Anaerolineae bacterium]|nr:hypothetical protein [Anaerolineae bacterium]
MLRIFHFEAAHPYIIGVSMDTVLIGIVALFFWGMGGIAILRPVWVLGLFQTVVSSTEGRNEVRVALMSCCLAKFLILP